MVAAMSRVSRPAGPPPTEAALHEAALAHLARYATTRAGLLAVLDRRIARWLRAVGDDDDTRAAAVAARAAARRVADRLVGIGVLDDAAFAANRARSLTRAGRSRRAVAAHLAARGVAGETAQAALPAAEAELGAAIALARRRRLGAFRTVEGDAARLLREYGAFARAGFSREVARQALAMGLDEAEALLRAMRDA